MQSIHALLMIFLIMLSTLQKDGKHISWLNLVDLHTKSRSVFAKAQEGACISEFTLQDESGLGCTGEYSFTGVCISIYAHVYLVLIHCTLWWVHLYVGI